MVPGTPLGHDDVLPATEFRPSAHRVLFAEDLVLGHRERLDRPLVVAYYLVSRIGHHLFAHAHQLVPPKHHLSRTAKVETNAVAVEAVVGNR
jgi:hypothetical protein